MPNILERIAQEKDLTKSEHKLASLVLKDPAAILNENIKQLAQRAGVSEPTVFRFCKRFGADGFPSFKLVLSGLVAKEKGEKEAMRLLSKLEVSKSQRRYNNLERHLPGSVFLYKGKRYVMQGQRTNGNYLIPVGHADWNLPRKQCTFVGFQSLAYI